MAGMQWVRVGLLCSIVQVDRGSLSAGSAPRDVDALAAAPPRLLALRVGGAGAHAIDGAAVAARAAALAANRALVVGGAVAVAAGAAGGAGAGLALVGAGAGAGECLQLAALVAGTCGAERAGGSGGREVIEWACSL